MPRIRYADHVERIKSNIREDERGCWNWQLRLDRHGYGRWSWRTRERRGTGAAHRLSFETFRSPIPAGLVIDHLCRNRACVNPGHMELVTAAENVRRGHKARSSAVAR